MITIIFEAHATSEDNIVNLASGWNDVALSELGEQQAKELGTRYADRHIDAVFCSDLQRSYRTAELAFDGKYPIMKDGRLRECDYGRFTQAGKHEVDMQKSKRITTQFPDGESYEDCIKRMRSFLDELREKYDGQTVMIIGHRATQYGLEHLINSIPLAEVVAAPWSWQPGWRYEMI